jgi:hypothetical protein
MFFLRWIFHAGTKGPGEKMERLASPESRTQLLFDFMLARETIRLRRLASLPRAEWTRALPVPAAPFERHRFTNVKRADDRTTRWLQDRLAKRPDAETRVVLFNVALFRWTGDVAFAEALGWQGEWGEGPKRAMLERASAWRGKVFTNAYVVPAGAERGAPKLAHVADAVLDPLWREAAAIVAVAARTRSWEATATYMSTALPWGFGAPGTSFFAKEILHDMALSGRLAFDDRDAWCPVGPGARRGLNWLHGRGESERPRRALEEMRALLALARRAMPPCMPELELHDVQFCLCEFGKYCRLLADPARAPRRIFVPHGLGV